MLLLTKLYLNFIKAFLVYLVLTEVTFFSHSKGSKRKIIHYKNIFDFFSFWFF